MENYDEVLEGLRIAAQTRTVAELADLLIEVGMSDLEAMDTIRMIAYEAVQQSKKRQLN